MKVPSQQPLTETVGETVKVEFVKKRKETKRIVSNHLLSENPGRNRASEGG